jgi:hypothetical protein
VQEWDADMSLYLIGHSMHCVGADNDEVRSTILNMTSSFNHETSCFFPLTLMLKGLDFREVNGVHNTLRRMKITKLFTDGFIDDPVVFDRRLPAHTTNKTDCLHGQSSNSFGVQDNPMSDRRCLTVKFIGGVYALLWNVL